MTTARPMAYPRATPLPCSATTALGGAGAGSEGLLFVLTEFAVEQVLDFGKRLVGIAARGFQPDSDALPGCQHNYPHDALGVDALGAARDEDFAAELAGQLRQLGGRTRMQAQLFGIDVFSNRNRNRTE